MADSEYERLIELVKGCPALFDTKSPIYRCKAAVRESWQHISTSMGRDVNLCKHVWMGLRSSYARHLQRQKQKNVKPWHLCERMEFLREHMKLWPETRRLYSKPSYGIHINKAAELTNNEKSLDYDDNADSDDSCFIIEDSMHEFEDEKEENSYQISNRVQTPLNNMAQMDSGIEVVDEREKSMSIFFQSIMFDTGRLSDRHLRLFKQDVYTALNKYLDAEEMNRCNSF